MMETAMNNYSVKAYNVKQEKLPAKKTIPVCVRKLPVLCLGKDSKPDQGIVLHNVSCST